MEILFIIIGLAGSCLMALSIYMTVEAFIEARELRK